METKEKRDKKTNSKNGETNDEIKKHYNVKNNYGREIKEENINKISKIVIFIECSINKN